MSKDIIVTYEDNVIDAFKINADRMGLSIEEFLKYLGGRWASDQNPPPPPNVTVIGNSFAKALSPPGLDKFNEQAFRSMKLQDVMTRLQIMNGAVKCPQCDQPLSLNDIDKQACSKDGCGFTFSVNSKPDENDGEGNPDGWILPGMGG